jgi:predicted TIM-barrel fold metal-dependent hydrolase
MRSDTIFDAHCHIIEPGFPLIENQGFVPEFYGVDAYRADTAPLGVAAGAVVSGSFQGTDQSYLLAVLKRLGDRYVGVTQLPADVGDDEILRLDAAGVRAIRFNLKRGGSVDPAHLEHMARRVHDLAGWHIEIYADVRDLAGHLEMLRSLPQISVDHLGLSEDGLPALLKLVEKGARVKATGFGRITGDIANMIDAIMRTDSKALMFGTDLPSTRTRRFCREDMDLVAETVGEEHSQAVFFRNAATLYRLPETPR